MIEKVARIRISCKVARIRISCIHNKLFSNYINKIITSDHYGRLNRLRREADAPFG